MIKKRLEKLFRCFGKGTVSEKELLQKRLDDIEKSISDLQKMFAAVDWNALRRIESNTLGLHSKTDVQEKQLTRIESNTLGLHQKEDDKEHKYAFEHTRSELYFWSVYRKEGESDLDSRKRFFRELPPATGYMREKQEILVQILAEIDVICNRNNIDYWIDCGTLLGAYRHGGFIPWDDDADVAMLRDDLCCFEDAVKESNIVELIHRFAVHCDADRTSTLEIARVRLKRFPECPLFVDIFIYDYCSRVDDEAWDYYLEARRRLNAACRPFANASDAETSFADDPDVVMRAIVEDEDNIAHITEKYEECREYLNQMIGTGPNSTKDGITWDLANFTLIGGRRMFKPRAVYPLQRMDFEGIKVWAPADPLAISTGGYGDIYTLPNDIASHEHFSGKVVRSISKIHNIMCNRSNEDIRE